MGKFIIAGGRTGIGRLLADRLLTAGHELLILGRSEPSGLGASATFHRVDFSDEQPVLPEVGEPIAGIAYMPGTIRLKPFRSLTAQDYLDDFRINVLGAIHLLRRYEANLKRAERPSVVLFSTVAVRTGMPFHASIASAKGAVEGLTRSLAAEWAPTIRVNAIAPSLTDTDLAAGLLSTESKRLAAIERHPLRRIVDPSEPASLAEWLLAGTSASVSGQVFPVDAGLGSLKTA